MWPAARFRAGFFDRSDGDDWSAQSGRWSRAAGAGLVVVLLGMSIFATWSSHVVSTAADSAVVQSRLSADYDAATSAILHLDQLADTYRRAPSVRVEAQVARAKTGLSRKLQSLTRDSRPAQAPADHEVLAVQGTYVVALDRLLYVVKHGNRASEVKVAVARADRARRSVSHAVSHAADLQHKASLDRLSQLIQVEAMTSKLTPVVFIAGLLFAVLLSMQLRVFRRVLSAEQAQAIHRALHDDLTGLPNRALFATRCSQALDVGHHDGTTTGLLLIDLDRFKDVNDTFGHHYGDLLLGQVGPRLVDAARKFDTVARLGGDEFAVLLPDVADLSTATSIASEVRKKLERPFRVDGIDLDVEASVGIVLSGQHGDDAATLLQHADTAMYYAKTRSLGVAVYDPVDDGHSPAKLALLGELRLALQRDELILHYQPKVTIATGVLIGAEALVRWQHPTRGLIRPDAFIPMAERTGLIEPLTRYVLDNALSQARAWADAGRSLQVAVNISARSLLDEGLPDMVARLLDSHGVPASLLKLEITESALFAEPARAQRLMRQLASLGVSLSIDDFGSGYTSLGQLKDLPISELKIDRSFVMAMSEHRNDGLIVQSVAELGHNLGLTIVAEGVETDQSLTALARLGCDVAQGFYLAPPMPVDTFDLWTLSQPAQPSDNTPGDQTRTHRLGPNQTSAWWS